MKRIMTWALAAALIISGAVMFSACSKSDDNDGDNPAPAKKKYRLVQRKDVYDNSDAYYITDYAYDKQGRLISYVRTGYNVTDIVVRCTYTYGDHYIIENHGDYSYYFTLNDDGLIIKHECIRTEDGEETTTPYFGFDYADGRVIKYEELKNYKLVKFQWENDDLMSHSLEDVEYTSNSTYYTYSEQSVDHGFTNPILSTMSEGLFLMGYYGKPSKHLESHRKSELNAGTAYTTIENDYTYTIADGHIVEIVDNTSWVMKMGSIESASSKKTTTTLTYEEY